MSVRYQRQGAAALITIDRPERRNAVDGPTAERLGEAYREFVADDGARVLVLTGAGPDAFCAGADLKALDTLAPRLNDPNGPLGFTRLTSPKPAIAAIGGWCLAGGLELALWCDLRIATGGSQLGFPERRWGVPLIDGGTQRLPRIVGQGRAMELILTGRIIGAEEAHAWGLVNELVDDGAHVDRAVEIAEGLARFPQETMLADRAAARVAAEPVTYERRGAAAVLTIDRPERRNAVDGPTAELLAEGYERFEADDDARVLILTGAGDVAFCAGADLKNLATVGTRITVEDGPLGFTRRISSKPTIAAISGWCLAGGLELALWCDLRICVEGSTLGFPERRWGVPLIDGGTQRMPRIIGLGRALDLILTGRMVAAEEALAMGLITEIVAPGRHLERALEIAEALAGFPQETMLADRRAAIEGIGMPFSVGLRLEAQNALPTFEAAQAGAARFAGGEGRGGAGAGV